MITYTASGFKICVHDDCIDIYQGLGEMMLLSQAQALALHDLLGNVIRQEVKLPTKKEDKS